MSKTEGQSIGIRALVALIMFAGIALVGGTPGAQSAAAALCSVPGQINAEPGGWTAIRAPAFPRGSATLSAYAVDPFLPTRMFATNGRVVMRSADAGCTWSEVYRLGESSVPELPVVSSVATIESVVVPASPVAHDRVYLVISERAMTEVGATEIIVRPRIVRSLAGGESGSWDVAEEGLLAYGRPVELVTVESAPDTMYLAATAPDGPDSRATLLYGSRDAGATWNLAVSPSVVPGGLPPEFSDIAVDPIDPARLWGAGPDGLWQSRNGGQEWERLPQVGASVAFVDIFHASGTTPRVWAFGPGSHRSDDGGVEWRTMPRVPAATIHSVTHGGTPDRMLATSATGSSSGRADGFNGAMGSWVLLKQFDGALRGASADRMPVQSFYAHTRSDIWKFSPPTSRSGTDFEPPVGGVGPPPEEGGSTPGNCAAADSVGLRDPIDPGIPDLAPDGVHLVLQPGESRTVPYALTSPGAPLPVDLYFVIDASASMGPAVCGVARGAAAIATRLAKAGVDAWFGVGTYQELPQRQPVYNCYSYRRDRDIAPLDASFIETLNRLRTCGGGDGQSTGEPQMNALVQTARGEGQPPWIEPGQQANFRRNAIPIVVDIGDETLQTVPGHNSIEEAVEALRGEGIRQVGVSMGSRAFPWMRRVADETDAIATGPVDCNGDGWIDVPRGEPLVCRASMGGGFAIPMVDAVSGMVLALKDEAPVSLVETTDSGVVAAIEPASYPAVDLRRQTVLDFDVVYSCTADQVGQSFPVELAAKVRADVVATATALVICTGLDVPTIPPPVAAAMVPPVPPPPPAPIPNPFPQPNPAPQPLMQPATAPAPAPQPQPNPQPNPQSNPQSQGQANPQAALAQQKQQQPQAAFAQAANKIAEQQEYSMSARRTSRDPLGGARVPLMLGGVAISLAYGCLSRTRRRTRVARAYPVQRRR